MPFFADLHIHSKYSRATAHDLDLEHLSFWAQRKGIRVVGTGDFTHPAWRAELRDKLVAAEPGLYGLRDDLERAVSQTLPPVLRSPVRFMLSVEISTIYKKGERTRKIHHLVYAPDWDTADRLIARLSRIGNLHSDGRPILGLDSRDLLEMVLESGPGAYLVPAHIWTPWFSVLGSKAGFDAVEECYGDLAGHIFALETGLSSDPAMNWRLSCLDRYRLVSSSDAHSPPKLGREASAFDTPLEYYALRRALETGSGYLGTVEFFPEEGKYHLDGHRKCGVRLEPAATRAHDVRCPACGQPLTVGVLHRVEALADRPEGIRPAGASDFQNLIPLPEVLAELQRTGAGSKTVERSYERLLGALGPELHILQQAPLEDIERAGSPLLGEAVSRMRCNRVLRDAGYDGEYGAIRLFAESELSRHTTVFGTTGLLFTDALATPPPLAAPTLTSPAPSTAAATARLAGPHRPDRMQDAAFAPQAPPPASMLSPPEPPAPRGADLLGALDAEQQVACLITQGPLLIIAGPGSGKTRTLTHRIAHLVSACGVSPEACLTVTFTRRAADELRHRLVALLGDAGERVPALTFHALGLLLLREHADTLTDCLGIAANFTVADPQQQQGLLAEAFQLPAARAVAQLAALRHRDRTAATPPEELDPAVVRYRHLLRQRRLVDFDELVDLAVALLTARPDLAATLSVRFRHLSVDEYQDIDARQLELVHLLAPADFRSSDRSLCAIGDPDQSIYRFRGADPRVFDHFHAHYPGTREIVLGRNYRSGRSIVAGARAVIAEDREPVQAARRRELTAMREDTGRIVLHLAATHRAEAEYVVHQIEQMIGGSTFFSRDSGRVGDDSPHELGFADFAILYRTDRQAEPLIEALRRSGMPFQKRSHRRLAQSTLVDPLIAALHQSPGDIPLAQRLRHAAMMLRETLAAPPPPAPAADNPEPAASLGEAAVDQTLALLLPLAERSGSDLGAFLSALLLEDEIDTWDPRAARISLLTLHAAKGLEFPVVFVIGCEDGLLPLYRSPDEPADVAEERRLFYVGMTRARERLVLTAARRRLRYGRMLEAQRSPFLAALPPALIEEHAASPRIRPHNPQLKLF